MKIAMPLFCKDISTQIEKCGTKKQPVKGQELKMNR
jgi:hypothetical protein